MKKNLQYKDDKLLDIFCYLVVPVVVSFPMTNFLDWWYYKTQKSFFISNNTLLFIHSEVANLIIFYAPFLISFLIMLSVRNVSYIKIFSLIAIVIFIISIFILGFKFFKYTDVNKEGIFIREGIFSTNKNYVWNDVVDVEVSYKRGIKSKIELFYNINLNDGTIVNTRNSEDFFSNIINLDNFMKDNKIKIDRSKIQPSDYMDFENTFKDGALNVVLEILNK